MTQARNKGEQPKKITFKPRDGGSITINNDKDKGKDHAVKKASNTSKD